MSNRDQGSDGVRSYLDELDRLLDGMGADLASRSERRLRRRRLAVRSGAAAIALASLVLVVSVPPTPVVVTTSLSEEPTFTFFSSAPVLENRGEGLDALEREYAPALRDAGIEGTTVVYVFLSATGTLENAVIAESSGDQHLDEAALRVARVFRFSAALEGGVPVAAWIQVPITFSLATPPPCWGCRGIGPAGPLAPIW